MVSEKTFLFLKYVELVMTGLTDEERERAPHVGI